MFHRLQNWLNQLNDVWLKVYFALCASLVAVGLGWLGDSLYAGLFEAQPLLWSAVIWGAVLAAIAALLSFLLGQAIWHDPIKSLVAVERTSIVPHIQQVYLLLSTLAPSISLSWDEHGDLWLNQEKRLDYSADSLEANIALLSKEHLTTAAHCSWQQTLRALVGVPSSAQIVIIGTEQSLKVAPVFRQLIAPFFAKVDIANQPVDHQEVSSAYQVIKQQLACSRFAPQHMLFDVTGTTSALTCAATLAALQYGVNYQYVSTTPPHQLFCYQVALRHSH